MQKRIKSWVFLSVFLAALLCHINIDAAQTEDKPVIRVNYVAMLNVLGKAGRDENLNAAPYYKKAFKLYVKPPERISADVEAWPKDLPEEKQTLLEDWFSANSNALEQLKLGAQKPYYWSEYQGSFVAAVLMPGLQQARILMRAICLRAKLSATKGDFKEAFSDLLVCHQFGEHFTGPKNLVEQLVGISIRKYTVEVAFQILDKEKPATKLLKDFQEKLQVLSTKQSRIIDFTFDKFFVYDVIQRMFTDDGKGGGHVFKGSGKQKYNRPEDLKELAAELTPTEEQLREWEKMERRQTTELTDKVFEYLDGAGQRIPAQLHGEGKDLEKAVEEIIKDNPMLKVLLPAYGRVLELAHRGKAETDALIVALGLLQYKAEKRQFPASLTELISADYLKELPIDPYSGKPLAYKRTENNFMLYSFGADFDDDGGVRSKWGEGEQGGDQVFWPVE